MTILRTSALGVVALVAGCSSAPESDPASASSGGTIHRTVVHLAADGTRTVTRTEISRSEQLQEIADRATLMAAASNSAPRTMASPVARDGSCAGSSLWLFSQPNLTGNELCLDGTGWFSLASEYLSLLACLKERVCTTWVGQVRSYWAGVDVGYLEGVGNCTENFAAWQRAPAAGPCGDGASWVVLGWKS